MPKMVRKKCLSVCDRLCVDFSVFVLSRFFYAARFVFFYEFIVGKVK